MHIHHHNLKQIVDLVWNRVPNGILVEAFTQDKDQLVLGIATPEDEMWLRVACGAPLAHLWPVDKFAKARRNVLDLLPEIRGKKMTGIRAVPWDRVVVIDFENGCELILKMHGLKSNVILRKAGEVLNLFRKGMEQDLKFEPLPGPFHQDRIAEDHPDLSIAERLRLVSPVLDKNYAHRVSVLMEKGRTFPEALDQSISEAESGNFYLLQEKKRLRLLVLDPAPQKSIRISNISLAMRTFFRSYFQYESYQRHFRQAERLLKKHLSRYDGQINSYYESVDKIENERPSEEIGHLIMANLHAIPLGVKKTELFDFYNDAPITIKLKPELNPQQNAERYYQKQKKHRSRIKHLEAQVERLEEERQAYGAVSAAFGDLVPPEGLEIGEEGFDYAHSKAMNRFVKAYMPLLEAGKPRLAEKKHPFLEFRKSGYTILCGKNARQNDVLSFQYSRKNDTWMHARDAFGSHVIISNPTGKDIPKEVIEYAAGLAAGYSKRKSEALVPVQYTERKYIRKVKNGAPGQVIVNREKVIMVEPIDAH